MNYLITGGCGFIGSHFIYQLLTNDETVSSVVNVDKLSSVSNSYVSQRFAEDLRYDDRGITTDIADPDWYLCLEGWIPDIVIHFAAESHVDRSCEDISPFIESNIRATMNITNYCINENIPLVYISTDEVYGELGELDESFTEESPINPRNPYAATKAAGEFVLTGLANVADYSMYAITRCSNNFGPLQDDTKLIPVAINSLLDGESVKLYGDGMMIRDWIHVTDHCDAIQLIANKLLERNATEPLIYNIGGYNEKTNREICLAIYEALDLPLKVPITYIDDPRGKAHDFRYAIDSSKIKRELGWNPTHTHPFVESIQSTVDWYVTKKDNT